MCRGNSIPQKRAESCGETHCVLLSAVNRTDLIMNLLLLITFGVLLALCSAAQELEEYTIAPPPNPRPYGMPRSMGPGMGRRGMGPGHHRRWRMGYHGTGPGANGNWQMGPGANRRQGMGWGSGGGGCPMLDMTTEERIKYLEDTLDYFPPDSIMYRRHMRMLEELRNADV